MPVVSRQTVHGQGAALPPGEAWPQEALLTQQRASGQRSVPLCLLAATTSWPLAPRNPDLLKSHTLEMK